MRTRFSITVMFSVLVVLSLMLGACQSADPPAPAKPAEPPKAEAPKPAEQPKGEAPAASAPAKPAEVAKAEAPAKPAPKELYKVGLLLSLTGPANAAGQGSDLRDGAVLQGERINAASGVDGHQIELVIEDDGSDPTKAATGLTKLIRQDKVLAISGPAFTAVFASAMAVAEREQTPTVVAGPLLPELRAQNPKWTFTQLLTEIGQVDATIDVLKEKGYKKVVAIASVDSNSNEQLEQLKRKGPGEGIEVLVTGDGINPKDVDFTPQVTKIKDLAAKEKPQAVAVFTNGQFAVPFLRAMKLLGINLPVVGPYAFGMDFLVNNGGDDINGVTFTGFKFLAPESLPDSDPQKALIQDYQKRFKAKYGREASGSSVMGPDGINIVANALKTSGPDRDKLRDALEKTTNLIGINGMTTYNGKRDGFSKQSLAVYEIKNKKWVFVRNIK